MWPLVLAALASGCGSPRAPVLLLARSADLADAWDSVASVRGMEAFPRWDGPWEWAPDPQDDGLGGQVSTPSGGWRPIQVGQPWQAQGIRHTGVAWYRRLFHVPKAPSLPVSLCLRSLEDSVWVYLDGVLRGRGGGAWDDLELRLDPLEPGPHTLLVRTVNPPDRGDPNRGGLAGPVDFSVPLDEGVLDQAVAVCISTTTLLSSPSAQALESYVRRGGTLVAVFEDQGKHWQETALELLLPTFLGLSPELVGRVRPVAVGPLASEVPLPDTVEVVTGVHPPQHPRFARPGTREISRWQLSPLAWGHRVEVEGDDGARTPLLVWATYGRGRVLACGAPSLLQPPLLEAILREAPGVGEVRAPVGRVWTSARLPWRLFGLQGLEPARLPEADAVVASHLDSSVAQLVRRGAVALVTDPTGIWPEASPWRPGETAPPDPVPLTSQEAWQRLRERGEPAVLRVQIPSPLQVCILQGRYGAVRAAWNEKGLGREVLHGPWVLGPSTWVEVGVWPEGDLPVVHLGDWAVVTTSTGLGLSPIRRPTLREALGRVQWTWEDGLPALAVRAWGKGRVASFSVPVWPTDPLELDWGDVEATKARFLHDHTGQLLAWAVRELLWPQALLGPVEPGTEGVRVGVRADGTESFLLRWRWRDAERSLLCSHQVALARPRGLHTVTIPWPSPDEERIYGNPGEWFWLELALVSEDGARCLSFVVVSLPRPGPRVRVWLPPVQGRPPAGTATWPRTSDPLMPAGLTPASQYPLFRPGEGLTLWVETWGEVVPPRVVDLVSGHAVPLRGGAVRRTGSPWCLQRWETPPLRPSIYRAEAASRGRVFYVSAPTDVRSALWDKGKGVQVLGSLYEGVDPQEFGHENLCAHADSGIPWGPFAGSWPGPPWCDFVPNPFCLMPNGVPYREWNRQVIRSLAIHPWTGETLTVSVSLVDGFNGVPWPQAFIHPQHLALFAQWMEAQGHHGLASLDVDSLTALVRGPLDPHWRFFVASQVALPAHRMVRDELRAVSPGSSLTDQFDLPLLPTVLRIPEVERFATEWQEVFAISSSDPWNIRAGRDGHVPTYVVCLGKALAPHARVGHYHMEMLGGLGPERIGKACLVRRQNVDLFWMMAASREGWVPVERYLDGGGTSWLGGWQTWLGLCSQSRRGGHVALPEDWQALQTLFAAAEAVRPQRPRGFAMSAVSPRIPRDGRPQVVVGDQARLFSALRASGLPMGSVVRLDELGPLTMPEGLVLPVAGPLSDREKRALAACLAKGIPVGVVDMGLSREDLKGFTGLSDRQLEGLVILRGGNLRGPFWPEGTAEDYHALSAFVAALRQRCAFDVEGGDGVASYAFDDAWGTAVVLMDELGVARQVTVRVRCAERFRTAFEVLDGLPLVLTPSDKGYLVEVFLPAGGAAVVQLCHD